MLYKIMCNPMHPLYGALPVPYVTVRCSTSGALVAHRYTYAPPRCGNSQYRRNFIHLSVSLWNDLADLSVPVGLAGFKSRANAYLYSVSCSINFLSSALFPFSSLFRYVGIVGMGSFD